MEGFSQDSSQEFGPEILAAGIDREHADEALETLFARGERPLVTVPREYLSQVQERGLEQHPSWLPKFTNVVGTLGTKPYEPGDDRVVVRVNIEDPEALMPRMTGKDKAFHGIVAFKNSVHIGPDMLEIVDTPPQPRPPRIH